MLEEPAPGQSCDTCRYSGNAEVVPETGAGNAPAMAAVLEAERDCAHIDMYHWAAGNDHHLSRADSSRVQCPGDQNVNRGGPDGCHQRNDGLHPLLGYRFRLLVRSGRARAESYRLPVVINLAPQMSQVEVIHQRSASPHRQTHAMYPELGGTNLSQEAMIQSTAT